MIEVIEENCGGLPKSLAHYLLIKWGIPLCTYCGTKIF